MNVRELFVPLRLPYSLRQQIEKMNLSKLKGPVLFEPEDGNNVLKE